MSIYYTEQDGFIRSKLINIFGENENTNIIFEEISHSEMGTKKTPKPKELKGIVHDFTVKNKFLSWQIFIISEDNIIIRAKGFYEKKDGKYCEWGSEIGIDPDVVAWISMKNFNYERDKYLHDYISYAFQRDFPLDDDGLPIARVIEFAIEDIIKGIGIHRRLSKLFVEVNDGNVMDNIVTYIDRLKELLNASHDQTVRYIKNNTEYYEVIRDLLLLEDIKI